MKTSARYKALSLETRQDQARRIASVLAALSVLIGQETKLPASAPSQTPASQHP